MKISQIQKRVTQLEQAEKHPDPLRACLAVLNDQQLDALEELCTLRDAGFSKEEIPDMMGDRFAVVMEAKEKMEKQYRELTRGS